MKINNGISNASLKGKEAVQGSSQSGRDAAILPDADLYMPSQEWLRIQTLLRQQPEIRNDRIALAGDRLKAGHYLTPESAQQTAVAMMNSLD